MTHSASMRATSLAASAALLSAGALVALTFSYELPTLEFPFDPSPVVDVVEPPAPPPPEPVRQQTVRQQIADPIQAIDTASMENEVLDSTALPTEGVYGPPLVQTVTSPHWLRRPSNLQIYYPRRALERGIEGDVVLDCLVSTAGFLRCSVVSETPAGFRFADAARRIAADHQMRPAMRDGAPVEGRYRMQVPFRVE